MAHTTIAINGSTVVAPTKMDLFPKGKTTILVPIDGDVATQRSNNRDNYGDKNVVRRMSWDILPHNPTNYDWNHTVESLKALEGTEVNLHTSGAFGYPDSNVSIMVVNVDIEWVAEVDSISWYSVKLSYTHH